MNNYGQNVYRNQPQQYGLQQPVGQPLQNQQYQNLPQYLPQQPAYTNSNLPVDSQPRFMQPGLPAYNAPTRTGACDPLYCKIVGDVVFGAISLANFAQLIYWSLWFIIPTVIMLGFVIYSLYALSVACGQARTADTYRTLSSYEQFRVVLMYLLGAGALGNLVLAIIYGSRSLSTDKSLYNDMIAWTSFSQFIWLLIFTAWIFCTREPFQEQIEFEHRGQKPEYEYEF